MASFESSLTLDCPQERVFEFLLRPANVAKISPPEIGLHFVSAPEVVELGSRIEFKIQGYGQVQTFLHEIIALVAPTQIIEKQIKGLFGKWIHEHHVRTDEEGKSVVTDLIEFEPPSGLLGFLITKHKILEQLEDGFFHRHEQMKKLLAGET